MRRCTCSVLIALCSLVALRPAILAQHDQHDPGPLPKYVSEPIALFKVGLGPFTRKISSSNAEAQAFFDQGFQMMYAFAKLDAVRSFREAWKRDPECAICYWGEGWAWGSYLNGPMSAEQSPFAYAAMQKAVSLKHKATPGERAFIEALAVRYVPNFDVKTRVEQDKAYAPARHWLGAALLEAKRPADAERIYREDLKDHPHNGWSLLGLQQALKAQGRPSAEVDADLKASWSRSDTWTRASRF